MIYVIVIYDQFLEPLRRIPEKDYETAKRLKDYFHGDDYKVIIYHYEGLKCIASS